jgi:hypothetical protein
MSGIHVIDSFRGGISDFSDKGIAGSFKHGANLDIRKQVDSLTCGQALIDEGLFGSRSPSASESPSSSVSYSPSASLSPSVSVSASPSPTPSYSFSSSPSRSVSASPSPTGSYSPSPSPSPSGSQTSVFKDLIRFFVKASDGYTYGFGNTGYIYRRDLDGFWMQVYKDSNGQIKGACEKPSSGGLTYIYWATDKVLKRKLIPGRNDWNDPTVVASNLNSCDYHTMVQVGGALYIANKSWLALVGYDDSYTNEALDLVPGNEAKTLVERDGNVIIGTFRTSDPDRGVNGAVDTEVPLSLVGDGEIFYADMASKTPIKVLPGGGKCNPGGVCNEIEQVNFFQWEQNSLSWDDKQSVGNMALFAIYNADVGYGGIYSYGRKNKNHSFVLNLDQQFDADELGAIANVNGTTIVSYRDGTDFGVKAVDPDNKATGTYIGLDFKSPVKSDKGLRQPMDITNWKYVEIYCSPLPTGTSIEFWYKTDKTGSFVQAYLEDGTTSFDNTGEKKCTFLIGADAQIFEPKIVLNPNANVSPEIYRIRTYFD